MSESGRAVTYYPIISNWSHIVFQWIVLLVTPAWPQHLTKIQKLGLSQPDTIDIGPIESQKNKYWIYHLKSQILTLCWYQIDRRIGWYSRLKYLYCIGIENVVLGQAKQKLQESYQRHKALLKEAINSYSMSPRRPFKLWNSPILYLSIHQLRTHTQAGTENYKETCQLTPTKQHTDWKRKGTIEIERFYIWRTSLMRCSPLSYFRWQSAAAAAASCSELKVTFSFLFFHPPPLPFQCV